LLGAIGSIAKLILTVIGGDFLFNQVAKLWFPTLYAIQGFCNQIRDKVAKFIPPRYICL